MLSCSRLHSSSQLFPLSISTEGTVARKKKLQKESSSGNTIIFGGCQAQSVEWRWAKCGRVDCLYEGWVTLSGTLTDSCGEVWPGERGGKPSLPSVSVRCWPGWTGGRKGKHFSSKCWKRSGVVISSRGCQHNGHSSEERRQAKRCKYFKEPRNFVVMVHFFAWS